MSKVVGGMIMTYIVENLKPDEEIIYDGGMHWIILVFHLLWTWILYFIPMLYFLLVYLNTEFAITNQRVVVKRGILSTRVDEVPLDKINNIHVRQGIIGHLFGYGTIVVQSAATFGVDHFRYARDPMRVSRMISEQIDIYKQKQIYRQAEMIARSMR